LYISSKAVHERKTDAKDAEWIADLLQHGLLKARYIPNKEHEKSINEKLITIAIWHILKHNQPFKDLGVDYYIRFTYVNLRA